MSTCKLNASLRKGIQINILLRIYYIQGTVGDSKIRCDACPHQGLLLRRSVKCYNMMKKRWPFIWMLTLKMIKKNRNWVLVLPNLLELRNILSTELINKVLDNKSHYNLRYNIGSNGEKISSNFDLLSVVCIWERNNVTNKVIKSSGQFWMDLELAASCMKQGLHCFWEVAVRIRDVQQTKQDSL